MTRNWTQKEIDDSRAAALAEGGGKYFGGANIVVTAVTGNTITFVVATRTKAGSGSFTAGWGDPGAMWCGCPSELPSGATCANGHCDPGPLPKAGDAGLLYFSEPFATSRNFQMATAFKWPDRLSESLRYQPVELVPLRVAVTAINPENGAIGTVDVMDPCEAAQDQAIVSSCKRQTLQIATDYLGRFGVPVDPNLLKRAVLTVERARSKSDLAALADAWAIIADAMRHPDSAIREIVQPALDRLGM